MKTASKFLDPNTGLIVFKDCLTGADLTAAEIAAVTPCPTTDLQTDSVCAQPTGNVDPTLVLKGVKRVCNYQTTYLADGTPEAPTLLSTVLFDAAGIDITATHEVTACPADLIYAGEVCYPAA